MSIARRLSVVSCLLLLGAGAGVYVWSAIRSLDAPLQLAAPLRFKVIPGTSFARLAAELAARHVITQPRPWVVYARLSGLAPAIKAGEYEVQPGTTARELLMKMVNGQVLLHSFTIVDGWRAQDVLDALRRNPDISVTLAPAATDLMEKLGAPGVNPEGQFLPETYRFVGGTADIDLLRQAHAALEKELNAAWLDRDPELPLHNSQELLIMASIIEKESGLPQELGLIAGLYLHRLSIGMCL